MAGRHVPGGGIDYRAMLAHERMLQRQRMAEEERRGSLPLADTEDGTKSPDALALATLAGPVARLRYQRAFLTPAEQDAFQAACTPPPLAGPVGSSSAARRHRQWLTLPKRTLLLLGGVPHPSGMIAEPLPAWVLGVATRLAPLFGGRTPNQVLVNYYEAGCGIDAHADGPLFEPTAAIVSLVSPALMHFRPHPAPRTNTAIARGGAIVVGEGSTGHDWDDSVAAATSLGGGTAQLDVAARAFMEPGSLLVFDQDAFEAFTHEIASVQQEVGQIAMLLWACC